MMHLHILYLWFFIVSLEFYPSINISLSWGFIMRTSVMFISENIVRIVRNRDTKETTLAILPRAKQYISSGVLGDTGRLSSGKMVVESSSGLVRIFWEKNIIFEEKDFRIIDDSVVWAHKILDSVHIYGFGEKGGPLDKRGWKELELKNTDPSMKYHDPDHDPIYINIPFYIMAKPGYAVGIYIDSPSHMLIDPGVTEYDTFLVRKPGIDLDYYVFVGGNVRDIVYLFTELVGRTYMPPLWAIGFQQSKWSYKNEKEVMKVAKKLRELGIPCDVINLDIDYMDGFRVFTWHPKRFPRPREMIDRLHEMGFKVAINVDPYVKCDKKYWLYGEITEKDYYVKDRSGKPFIAYGWPGKCLMPDFTREGVVEWWGNLYLEFHRKYGVDGFWNDMNEPSVETRIRYLFGFGLKRDSMTFYNFGRPVGIEKIGNIYSLLECMGTYNALRKTGKRFFILSRSGFAGIQRYAANWTGDIWSSWKHLARSVSMMLGMGLCGLSFVGADIGGFAPILKRPNQKLFTRWVQLGVFYPLMRIHYIKYKPCQEPWCFGNKVLDIVRRYIRFRYRLLPYIYSLFWESHKTGIPIMRPLFLEFPDDEESYVIDDEFMFGPSMLVAPILGPENRRRVYLPRGLWLDFWDMRVVESSGACFDIKTGIDRIPIFIRDGGIVVMQDTMNYVGERRVSFYDIILFSVDRRGEFIIYEDDGETYRYENGEYSETKIIVDGAHISIRILNNGYGQCVKRYRINIFHRKKPRRIVVDGEKIEFTYSHPLVSFWIVRRDCDIEIR